MGGKQSPSKTSGDDFRFVVLMNDSREEVSVWLNRKLDAHYLVIYIDATFVHTRRDKSVSSTASTLCSTY